jgi:hypothetical protein
MNFHLDMQEAPHMVAGTSGRRPAFVSPSPLGYVGRWSRLIGIDVNSATSRETMLVVLRRDDATQTTSPVWQTRRYDAAY